MTYNVLYRDGGILLDSGMLVKLRCGNFSAILLTIFGRIKRVRSHQGTNMICCCGRYANMIALALRCTRSSRTPQL